MAFIFLLGGLVIGVAGWVLLFNRRQKTDVEADDQQETETGKQENESRE